MTALREAVMAAAAARLTAQLAGVQVERARRAPMDVTELPAVVVTAGDVTADENQSPTECFWTFDFTVTGYAKGSTDLACEQALSALHASVIAALQGYDLGPGTVQTNTAPASFDIYTTEDSDVAAGQFEARFAVLAVAPVGSPFAP